MRVSRMILRVLLHFPADHAPDTRYLDAVLQADAARKAAQTGGANGKFAGDDLGGTFEGKFASAQAFHGGLDRHVGLPSQNVLEAVISEHKYARNAATPYKTSNYGLTCTPEEELVRRRLPRAHVLLPRARVRDCWVSRVRSSFALAPAVMRDGLTLGDLRCDRRRCSALCLARRIRGLGAGSTSARSFGCGCFCPLPAVCGVRVGAIPRARPPSKSWRPCAGHWS